MYVTRGKGMGPFGQIRFAMEVMGEGRVWRYICLTERATLTGWVIVRSQSLRSGQREVVYSTATVHLCLVQVLLFFHKRFGS
jgi:hypothetical protein